MLVLNWGTNVCKMVKFTPVDRRLFVRCVDFLLNYVARKLSLKYEILKKLKKTSTQKSERKNFTDRCYFYLFEYQMFWFDCTAKHNLFPLICFPTKESIVARVVPRGVFAVWLWAYSGRARYQRAVTLSVTFIYCFQRQNGKCKLAQCVGFLNLKVGG